MSAETFNNVLLPNSTTPNIEEDKIETDVIFEGGQVISNQETIR